MRENETRYHYTSANALQEMITDRGISLWFSRFDCLNDTSESRVAVDIQQKVCDELKGEYENDGDKIRILDQIRDMQPDFEEIFFGDSVPLPQEEVKGKAGASITAYAIETIPYICCFSYEKDAITMWNYYTKGNRYEGYNIGLDPYKRRAKLVDINGNVADGGPKVNFGVLDVIYDTEKQKAMVREVIEHYLDKGTFSELEERTYMLSLNKWAMMFKNEAFKHEREERLICSVPVHGNPANISLKEYIRFRELNGCLIPYLNVLVDKAALKEVTIGPLIESEIAKSTVELMLELREYEDVKVRCSKVPVRY